MKLRPSNLRIRAVAGTLFPCLLGAAALLAGQPVEPPRNPFSDDAWQLPAETAAAVSGPLQTHCQLCHSTDYLSTQPPLTRAQWTAIVEKMRGKFGAVIATNQVPALVESLASSSSKPGGATSGK
jgi:hypothetical protein